MATIDKMPTQDLISAYYSLVEEFKNSTATPDDTDYDILEVRLKNVEAEIEKRRPGYFKKLQRAEVFDRVYDENYTPQQVAIIFDVSRQTIYNWINKGIMPIIKIGNKAYIAKKVVERIKVDGTKEKTASS